MPAALVSFSLLAAKTLVFAFRLITKLAWKT